MRKLYWKMYQSKEETSGQSVVLTLNDMLKEIEAFASEMDEDELPPVFEPVYMTEEEFNDLEEFQGF